MGQSSILEFCAVLQQTFDIRMSQKSGWRMMEGSRYWWRRNGSSEGQKVG